MPVSAEFVDSVVAKLNAARPVRHRKMFGGLGFYYEEVFFAVGDDDRLFFKTDEHNSAPYVERGMENWVLEGKPSPNYHEVPGDVLNNPQVLGEWIERSAQAAVRLKKKK